MALGRLFLSYCLGGGGMKSKIILIGIWNGRGGEELGMLPGLRLSPIEFT